MLRTDLLSLKENMNTIDMTYNGTLKGDFVTLQAKQILRAKYDFAISGGAVGAIQLLDENGKPAVIPNKCIITKVLIDVVTGLTSGGLPTIALGANTTTDLKAATAMASYTGIVAGIPVETAASCVKTTADRIVTATIATAALTAGKFYVMVEYIVSE